jgi:methionyl aminopeptidase
MIIIKSKEEIGALRRANRAAAEALEEAVRAIRPGVTTRELDDIAREGILRRGAKPAFLGYMGYPASLCVSLNEQVVHGIPSDRKIAEGDLVSLDIGAVKDGFVGDLAVTVPVGEVGPRARELLRITRESLYRGIEQAREGNRLYDISAAVEAHVAAAGFSVVRQFVGHGIGRDMHEEPQIPNYGKAGTGVRLKAGMTFAIEPMVNVGAWQVKVLSDGWTVVTTDGSLSAHFEHSIAITEDGPVILSELS